MIQNKETWNQMTPFSNTISLTKLIQTCQRALGVCRKMEVEELQSLEITYGKVSPLGIEQLLKTMAHFMLETV